jgi:D-alanine-D-alanine ligase
MGKRTRLVVLFGGQSAEHDVSCVSARHIVAAADPDRYEIVPIGITRDGAWLRSDEAIAALAAGPAQLPDHLTAAGTAVEPRATLATVDDDLPTVVFPVLHGPMGEDGTIQGLLELTDVPYVGSGVLASAMCMDKIVSKRLAAHHGIPQANYHGFHADDITDELPDLLIDLLGVPLFVKPANLGSSVGVSKARTHDELVEAIEVAATYDEWIVVEECIVGREIEVSVLGNREPQASLPGEVLPAAEFYSYADKYLDGTAQTQVPADLPEAISEQIRTLAVTAYSVMRCEGLARVDFFYEETGRGPLLNEINTMPGFTPISMYPKMWDATGIDYGELIDRLVDLALRRDERRSRHRSTER